MKNSFDKDTVPREMKIAIERERISSIARLRKAQRKYFSTRSVDDLRAMRDAEAAVRAWLFPDGATSSSSSSTSPEALEVISRCASMLQHQAAWIAAVGELRRSNPDERYIFAQNEELLRGSAQSLEQQTDLALERYYTPALPNLLP